MREFQTCQILDLFCFIDGKIHDSSEADKEDDKEQSGSGESDEEDEEENSKKCILFSFITIMIHFPLKHNLNMSAEMTYCFSSTGYAVKSSKLALKRPVLHCFKFLGNCQKQYKQCHTQGPVGI